ncbi:MAG: chemotaxis protein CheV [Lachnospiraceae bacterium]|nr:chemotaxis protein CheV [Lachnospiraceae bacterium]
MENKILLESGTNELEVLEFEVSGNHYGINVAKVEEILTMQKITPVPNSHPSIEGMFMPRGKIITVMNLYHILGFPDEGSDHDMLIVTNFNNLNIGFRVHQVMGIHRVSWNDIIKPDATINGAGAGMSTGIIKYNDDLIMILDFERIVEEICPETSLKVSEIDRLGDRPRNEVPILIAEDSPMLSKMIQDSLEKAGYTNLTIKANGQEAWDVITTLKKNNGVQYGVKLLITDIEMPVMDGHRLVKLVRDDDELKDIPIVIFSSLINEDMKRKGDLLGANAQVSKPEIGMLVHIIDDLLEKAGV